MPQMFQKTAATLVLAFAVIPLVLGPYCVVRCDPFRGSPATFRAPGLYSMGAEQVPHHTYGSSPLLEFRYWPGMDRNEIRREFAGRARLIASDARPNKNWAPNGDPLHGLASCVLEFERGQHTNIVAACDIYDDGQYQHVLFFDDAGRLVGADRCPSHICLSKVVESANESMETNGHRSIALVTQIKFERVFYARALLSVAVAHVGRSAAMAAFLTIIGPHV